MRSVVRALAACVLVACASAGIAEPAGLKLVDVTGDFDRVAASTAALSDKERVAEFEKSMAGVANGFYVRSRKPERYDERVLKNLTEYPQHRAAILKVARDFRLAFAPARASFERRFGRVSSSQPVYILHSLGEMDGGTRDLNGKSTLLFGADVIAKIHGDNDIAPFFHHELFHVYHRSIMPDCEPLWCSLWEEGLATYVAKTLNPQAGEEALMLDLPAPIRPAVDANRAAAVCAVVPLLNSADEKDYSSLFYGNAHLPGMPARMGYYIGYLVAADLGRTRTLQQLARLKPAETRRLIDQSLARMAKCGSTGKPTNTAR